MTRQTAAPDDALLALLREAQTAIDPFVARRLDQGAPYTDAETAFLLWHSRFKLLVEPYTGELPLPDMSTAPPLTPDVVSAAGDFARTETDGALPCFPAWKRQTPRAGGQWAAR